MTDTEINPDDPRVVWTGLACLMREGRWWQPWRVGPRYLPELIYPQLHRLAQIPAGASAAFITDADRLSVPIDADEAPARLDVVINDQLSERLLLQHGAHDYKIALPGTPTRVQLWLPQTSRIRLGAITARNLSHLAAAPAPGPRWIAYGSSITQCHAAYGPSQTWPALVAQANRWQLTCLGMDGECHLDPPIASAIAASDADTVSLCVGVNIHRRASYGPRALPGALAGFLTTVRTAHPGIPISVITPLFAPDREHQANSAGMTLVDIRTAVADTVTALQHLGDTDLHLIDGLSVLGPEHERLLHDGVHPDAEGYVHLADVLGPALAKAADA
jgi:hypothetical protein